MESKRKQLAVYSSIAGVGIVIVIVGILLLNQPLQTATPENPPAENPPTTPPETPPTESPAESPPSTTPPSSPPSTTPGEEPESPPPPPLGNGNIVPVGWSTAKCPELRENAVAHGLRARCEHAATYAALKKAGLVPPPGSGATSSVTNPGGNTPNGVGTNAWSRTSDPGNSGEHRSSHGRQWG